MPGRQGGRQLFSGTHIGGAPGALASRLGGPGSSRRARRTAVSVVLAMLVLGLAPAAASAVTFTVNDDTAGPGPSGADCAHPDFSTIQAAIDAAGAFGDGTNDTINVCAGTYNEALDVSHAGLTLRGAQAGVDARDRTGAAESIINIPDAASIGIQVEADDLTLDGFTITDAPSAAAIRTFTNTGHLIENNIISQTAEGTFLEDNSGGTVTVRHNFYDGNSRNPGSGDGIQTATDATAHFVIDQNRFRGDDSAAIVNQAAPNGMDVTDNTSDNDATFFVTQNGSTVDVARNTLTGTYQSAIFLASGNNGVTIENNSVGSGAGRGIRFGDDFGATPANQNVAITGNTITGRTDAISIVNGMVAGTLEVHFNRIAGNTTGIDDEDTDVANTVDAANNWWGCNAGPGSSGCDPISGAGAAHVSDDPRLVLALSATPPSVQVGGQSHIAARLASSGGGATATQFPNGIVIPFTATLGSIVSPTPTSSGQAGATFNAGQTSGQATISASLDNQSVGVPVAISAVAPSPQPSGFRIGNTKHHKKNGTVTVPVTVPVAGVIQASGHGVVAVTRSAAGAGTFKLLIKAKGKLKKRLNEHGRVTVTITVNFAPTHGPSSSKSRTIAVVKKKR